MERKIFNYESIILRERTLEKYGYCPEKFGPTSNKFVVAICRYCGQESFIRKGFFTKSGSACHKECRFKEQKISPFSDPKVREKAKKAIEEKYGVDRKEIAEKISKSKKTKEVQDKYKKTCLEKYGVENVFQNSEIKEKIKNTMIEKYGVERALQNKEIMKNVKKTNLEIYGFENPMQNSGIQEKAKATNIERYGVDNSNKHNPFVEKRIISYNSNIYSGNNLNYLLCNTLEGEEFWDFLNDKNTLKSACKKFNLDYQSCTSALLSRYKEKYHKIYTFPKTQKQKEMFDFVSSFGFSCEMNNRLIISPLELDIYIPEKKLAIEFNGSYWHSEACIEHTPEELTKMRKRHYIKTKMCQEKGIRLLHIFENQWNCHEEQWKAYIKNLLGINSIKIFARKCDVTNTNGCGLIKRNHLQGFGRSPICYFSLVYENNIVATMTAEIPHRQNMSNDSISLGRLVFEKEINVIGGASRLFSEMKKWAKSNGYKKIVSWSDNCYSYGDIYETLGFKKVKEHGPDYFYWDSGDREYKGKQSQQKKATGCPDGMTEREWCLERGLFRIWDAGKISWEYKLD